MLQRLRPPEIREPCVSELFRDLLRSFQQKPLQQPPARSIADDDYAAQFRGQPIIPDWARCHIEEY